MISFFVPGKAQPGGSKKSIGRNRIIDANPHVHEWRGTVALAARKAMIEHEQYHLLDAALYIECTFYRARPKAHFDSKGNLRDKFKDAYPAVAPDTTKLFRSTEDAMKNVIYTDDSRIVQQSVGKRYGETPGARIIIMTMWEFLANE